MRTWVHNIGQLATAERSVSGPDTWTSSERMEMLIDDGRIVAIGRNLIFSETVEAIDAGGRLVTPGLIDAHTHPVFGANRCGEFEMRSMGKTYEEIAAAGGGIHSSVRSTRACSVSDLEKQVRRHLAWMASCGTTTVEAKTGYGLSLEAEIAHLTAIHEATLDSSIGIVPTLLAAHAVGPEFGSDRRGYMDHVINAIIPEAVRQQLVRYVDIFVEQRYFDADDARALAQAARHHGLGLRMHVDQLSDSYGATLAAELGAVTADHLEHANPVGIAAMKAAGTIPVLLPASVYCLGKSRYPDARAMIEAGLPVVLATDFNPGSSPTPSLPFVMSLACTQMRMTPAEAWLGVTSHAARSLELEQVGTLEVGMAANFVIWDAQDWREVPYWVDAPLVHAVCRAGKRFSLSR